MAYSVTGPVEATINGLRYLSWTVIEADAATDPLTSSSEWCISGVPLFFTLTLFEAASSLDTATVNPELGLAASWSTTSLNHIADNDVAACLVRNDARVQVTALGQKLYGRSRLGGSGTPTITTRITLVEGH
jgi:hypothetical protein